MLSQLPQPGAVLAPQARLAGKEHKGPLYKGRNFGRGAGRSGFDHPGGARRAGEG